MSSLKFLSNKSERQVKDRANFTLQVHVYLIISNMSPVLIGNALRLIDAGFDLNSESVVVLGMCQVEYHKPDHLLMFLFLSIHSNRYSDDNETHR